MQWASHTYLCIPLEGTGGERQGLVAQPRLLSAHYKSRRRETAAGRLPTLLLVFLANEP